MLLPLLSLYSASYYSFFIELIRTTIAAFLAVAITIAIILIKSYYRLFPLPIAPTTTVTYSLFPLLIAPTTVATLPYIIPLGLFYF